VVFRPAAPMQPRGERNSGLAGQLLLRRIDQNRWENVLLPVSCCSGESCAEPEAQNPAGIRKTVPSQQNTPIWRGRVPKSAHTRYVESSFRRRSLPEAMIAQIAFQTPRHTDAASHNTAKRFSSSGFYGVLGSERRKRIGACSYFQYSRPDRPLLRVHFSPARISPIDISGGSRTIRHGLCGFISFPGASTRCSFRVCTADLF
jgi:hypothetical protein